jgi:hypothetical protein
MSANRKPRRPGRWRQSIPGPWAPRRIEMLESPAYRVLSLSARKVLDRIEIELSRHAGNDNGKLPITYADFEAYGMDRHALPRAIREVVALGFITCVPGRAGNAEFRTPSKYGLTYRHFGKADPTDEWKHIQTIEEAGAIARNARNAGGQGDGAENCAPARQCAKPLKNGPGLAYASVRHVPGLEALATPQYAVRRRGVQ